MRIHDISLPIQPGMPIWPGDPGVQIERVASIERGDRVNVSQVCMGVHTGTHVDAPIHFLPDGSGVETLDMNALVGPAWVFDLPDVEAITADVLQQLAIPPGTQRVLFRTRNSRWWAQGEKAFQRNFVAIAADGARWLVDHGVRLVGVDYLSVAPFEDGVSTHRTLLQAGVIPIEGLDLHDVEPGQYTLVCLPLRLAGSDGAPARVILIEEGDR